LEHTTSTSYPSHNTTIPFTRFLAGFADYTPLSFRQDVIAGTTLAHQVATLIVFTSPFMCLAVNPDSLLVSPVKNIVTNLPTTWDETRVLPPSEVGQLAMFARRKGTTWYLGVLNGPNTNTLSIPLSFLGAGSYQTTVVADNPASVAKAYILNTNYTNSGTINVKAARLSAMCCLSANVIALPFISALAYSFWLNLTAWLKRCSSVCLLALAF
jgi:hypothetical protein